MIEINKIYNENCIETMKNINDQEVDIVITSPPYNMNWRVYKGKYISRQLNDKGSKKYEGFTDNLPVEEFYELHSNILMELLRVSKIIFYNIQIVTGSKRAFFKMIGEFNEHLKDIIIWDKVNSQPAMQKNVLNSQNELILIFGDNPIGRAFSKVNFERGTLSNIWKIKRGKKISSSHGAVFPEELVNNILINFSNENDLVYDPFMGTGTVAVCSKHLKRNYIGSEISKDYCEIAENRLSEEIF